MVNFEVSIFLDLLELLRKPVSVPLEVQTQLSNGDDYAFDQMHDGIEKALEDEGMDEDEIEKVFVAFDTASAEDIMKFVVINLDDAYVNAGETREMADDSMAAFTIPCEFNLDKFRKKFIG